MNTATPDKPPTQAEQENRPRIAKLLRVLAIPIIVFWVLVGVATNVLVPSLDATTAANAGPLVGRDAPSSQAAILTGNEFKESNFTSVAVVLLETKGRTVALSTGDWRRNQDWSYPDDGEFRRRGNHSGLCLCHHNAGTPFQ